MQIWQLVFRLKAIYISIFSLFFSFFLTFLMVSIFR